MFGTIHDYEEAHSSFRRVNEVRGLASSMNVHNILVVEDSAGAMLGLDKAIRSVLGITNYDVATTLQEALSEPNKTYDVLLLDDRLPFDEGEAPKEIGYVNASKFSSLHSGVIIIGTSSSGHTADVLDGTMDKSFTNAPESLYDTLEKIGNTV